MIGQTVLHYEIEDRLGGGGMGVVYRARDTRLGRRVALKFLPPGLVGDDTARERFVQEARAASALNHESVCAIHDIGETEDGRFFIVMALYDGDTLRHRLTDGPMPVDETVGIVRQIAGGLRAAHDRGIVHRDIKPSNIIVTEEGRAVVLDFGLAKLSGGADLTRMGSTVGTARYMSPEQTVGTSVDHRTDIWSLGVVLFECLAGRPPFDGAYEQAIVYSILNTDPDLNELPDDRDTGRRLRAIVERALAKEPDERYETMAELHLDLDGVFGEADSRSDRGDDRRGAGAAAVRWKRPAAVALAAVLIIASALFVRNATVGPRESGRIQSLAVLPLTNYSGNTDQDFLAAGMTDALINELARIGSIRVISRQSVVRFADSDLGIPQIAEQLGVDGIVSGSVIRTGDSIRVAAHLLSSSEESLWSDAFVGRFENILQLYVNVTREIAASIDATIRPDESARMATVRTVNPQAYELYLRGHHHLYKLSASDTETARTYFEESLEIDPTYAEAHAGVAAAWIILRQMGAVAPSAVEEPIRVALATAEELDSTLAIVHYTKAVDDTWTRWDFETGAANFRKALSVNPNHAEAHAYYGHLLTITGDNEAGIRHSKRALELDPFNALFRALYADNLMFDGQFEAAAREFLASQETAPNSFVNFNGLNWVYREMGRFEDANRMRVAKYVAARDEAMAAALREGFAVGGYREASMRAAELLVARSDTSFVGPIQIQRLYVDAGEAESAIDWAERAVEVGDPGVPYLGLGPDVEIMSRSDRYLPLLARVGVEAHWERRR